MIRLHKNLGHPAPGVLARHLQAAKADPKLIAAARDFHVIRVIDEASCFHLGRRAPSHHAGPAAKLVSEMWFSWAGTPSKVYVDPAGEFRPEEWLTFMQGVNAQLFLTTEPWQRGRIERHGDVVKHMLERLDADQVISSEESFDAALLQCFQAKNALVRQQGYSPEQIVLGKSVALPGSNNTSDENTAAHLLMEGQEPETELQRQRLELRCRARQAYLLADNEQAIRRATLRKSTPARGPYQANQWVLYWLRRGNPNRLGASRWHGPAKVICQEGSSVVWISHGPKILRRSPEQLRLAFLREWMQTSPEADRVPSYSVGGSSTFIDLQAQTLSGPSAPAPGAETATPAGLDIPSGSHARLPVLREPGMDHIVPETYQPQTELTPQVSRQQSEQVPEDVSAPSGVERTFSDAAPPLAAPSQSTDARDVPVPNADLPDPDLEDASILEHVLLASEDSGISTGNADALLHITTLESGVATDVTPLAEDGFPYITDPLECGEHQAYVLEIPIKSRDLKKWASESSPAQMVAIAAAGKRARAEVSLKDLNSHEVELFHAAKKKEIQCWMQTSAIRKILRSRLNPDQILRSRWVLTWKSPEPGSDKPRAKARLVVLGFQDPKLTEVLRDAPTLSKEGRALVLQTIASAKFRLGSFDITTAFLRGKADESNPLAMDPPREVRKALNMSDDEVCQLLGNAYGRVDAPLLFYKELSSQLRDLGFIRHLLEPCVFMLYTGHKLHGLLGMHVDDGIYGGDELFEQKLELLQKKLPFGSHKHDTFVFTGISLEQLPDYTIKTCQAAYVETIPQIDIGRHRRQDPTSGVTEAERSKLRGLIGSLQYAATHSRPDIAARVGALQSQVTKATVQTLFEGNRTLRETQEHRDVSTFFLPIPVADVTFVAFGDASFANSRDLNSHQGTIICATNSLLAANREAPVSPMTWISKKIPRVVRSTLSAMSKSVDTLGWIRSLWGCVHVPNYPWGNPAEGFKIPRAIVVTDCRSLYDLVSRLAMPACEEFRTTLEALLIKQRTEENVLFKWIPTSLMLADALTKCMEPSLLRRVLKQCRFVLYDSDSTLDKTAQRRQAISWLETKRSLTHPRKLIQ